VAVVMEVASPVIATSQVWAAAVMRVEDPAEASNISIENHASKSVMDGVAITG